MPCNCKDQLIQGEKISKLGCGVLLRPRRDFVDKGGSYKGKSYNVVNAVRNMLEQYDSVKQTCERWRAKVADINGLELTAQTIARLIVGRSSMKSRGGWQDMWDNKGSE